MNYLECLRVMMKVWGVVDTSKRVGFAVNQKTKSKAPVALTTSNCNSIELIWAKDFLPFIAEIGGEDGR